MKDERYITTMIKKTPSALIKSCIARECLLSSDGVHLILRKFCLKVMQSNHKLLRTIWFVCPALENTPQIGAANRLIGEVVQSRRRPLLGSSSG